MGVFWESARMAWLGGRDTLSMYVLTAVSLTAAYHTGEEPDSRTLSTLEDNGIVDYEHYARRVR